MRSRPPPPTPPPPTPPLLYSELPSRPRVRVRVCGVCRFLRDSHACFHSPRAAGPRAGDGDGGGGDGVDGSGPVQPMCFCSSV
jgi:hypothetical protein